MPEFGRYRVKILDHTAAELTDLFPGDDFLSISWEHKLNQPGAYACELVAETTTKDQFRKRYQVLIERNWNDDPSNWYEEFTGFHLGYIERWPTGDVDEHYWSSVGLSPEWIIDQAILHPVVNEGNSNWVYYDTWWDHNPADDVVKRMVGESMTSPAETDRTFTNLALQGNSGEGNWGCYEDSWVRLMDAIVDTIGEDGDRGGCDFRVERISGGYEFKTYAPYFGTDRRRGNEYGNKPTIFSYQNGNMKNAEKEVMWAQSVTAAYGGWQGGGMERTIYLEENADALAEDVWARREAFYDVRDVTTPDAIPGWLQQKLRDDGEKELVRAEILQTDACLYGRDWWFGDLVTLDLPDGTTYDMRVVEVRGRLSGENEEEIEGVIELWDREAVTT